MADGFLLCFSVLFWRCEWEQLRLCDQDGNPWLILHWECGEQDPLGRFLVIHNINKIISIQKMLLTDSYEFATF